MVKIKQKKQLNLPQLIEWAMENDIKVRVFESNPNFDGVTYRLGFDKGGDLYFEESLAPTLLFTVEVEEEITEETHLDYLYALTNDDEKEIHRCMNFTIRNASMVIGRNDLTFFTLVGNDLVKIYENGKLVE